MTMMTCVCRKIRLCFWRRNLVTLQTYSLFNAAVEENRGTIPDERSILLASRMGLLVSTHLNPSVTMGCTIAQP